MPREAGGELTAVIEQELERVDLPELQGLTFDEVLVELNEDVTGTSSKAPEG